MCINFALFHYEWSSSIKVLSMALQIWNRFEFISVLQVSHIQLNNPRLSCYLLCKFIVILHSDEDWQQIDLGFHIVRLCDGRTYFSNIFAAKRKHPYLSGVLCRAERPQTLKETWSLFWRPNMVPHLMWEKSFEDALETAILYRKCNLILHWEKLWRPICARKDGEC